MLSLEGCRGEIPPNVSTARSVLSKLNAMRRGPRKAGKPRRRS